jgi:hypothetical protein
MILAGSTTIRPNLLEVTEAEQEMFNGATPAFNLGAITRQLD